MEEPRSRNGSTFLPWADPVAWQEGLQSANKYLGLGVQLAGSMVIWVLGGYFLDRWLETTPWLTIVGGVVGMVAFFYQLMRLVKNLERDEVARKEHDQEV